VTVSLLYPDCTQSETCVKDSIDMFYNDLVGALNLAATHTVPVCSNNFFKFWWDEECQILKIVSI